MQKKHRIVTFLFFLGALIVYVFEIHILLGSKLSELPVYKKYKEMAEIRSNLENENLMMHEPSFEKSRYFNADHAENMKNMVNRIDDRIKNLTATGPPRNVRMFLPKCELNSNNTASLTIEAVQNLKEVQLKYPEVMFGGWYRPLDCDPQHKVAIIVPYRNREQSLVQFLNHMHPFLMKQKIEYGIFVVEQYGLGGFNRAKLFNVGFVESGRLRAGGWQCFVFHDVDLLPLDQRNLYSCPRQPRHMSAAVDKHHFKYMVFGGVVSMTRDQFINVNGFSNKYVGWGGEDDDMYKRLTYRNYSVIHYPPSIGRYKMLVHHRQQVNPARYLFLSECENFEWDGLSNLEYDRIQISFHHLHTHIVVKIDNNNKAYRITPFTWKTVFFILYIFC